MAKKLEEVKSVDVIPMTVKDVLIAEQHLTRLSGEKIDFAASFNVSRMLMELRSIKTLFTEKHDALVQTWGEDRPPTFVEKRQGLRVVKEVKVAHLQEYDAEVKKMERTVVEINRAPIKLSTLKRGCPTCGEERVIDIEPDTLAALGPLITE